MTTTQVTDEAMMAASMSLFISDQGMLNAGISSVVFSNAVGATEGTLNLINADTVTDEKLRAELKEEEEKNQDAFEAAADMAIAMVEEQLKRLSDPVMYANGQFTIGGITVDEEDMDVIVDSMVNEFDAVVAQHNLDAEQSATLFALLTAYQNAEDPQVKAQILQKIGDEVSPEVRDEMAADAAALDQNRVIEVQAEQKSEANLKQDDVLDYNAFKTAASPTEEFTASANGLPAETKVAEAEIAKTNDFEFSLG